MTIIRATAMVALIIVEMGDSVEPLTILSHQW